MENPNWLYCVSNEDHKITEATMIGMVHIGQSMCTHHSMFFVDLEREDVARFSIIESFVYLLSELDQNYEYVDMFFNVSESDLTWAKLKYGFNRMFLIDKTKKEKVVKKMARDLFEYLYSIKYCDDEREEMIRQLEVAKPLMIEKLRKTCEK